MTGQPRLSRLEFVAMMAMLVATVAFSLDSMLPALPRIGAELTPDALNRAQLVVTSFILGLGVGTLFTGPLSDSFGRKRVILIGSGVYILGAGLAWIAPSLELMIAARIVQGLGAAAARIVALAIVRDLYSGREMARLMSFVMMVFTLVPAVSPLAGSVVIGLFGWRAIFLTFILFALACSLWLALRLDEPLPPEKRRPFRRAALVAAMREVLANPTVRLAIAVQMLCMTTLFCSISMIQQIFSVTFDRAPEFPFWFFIMAVIAGAVSFLNASIVVRLGMQRMVSGALGLQIVLSGAMVLAFSFGLPPALQFPLYIVWQTTVFANAALTLGNINALGMEPLGHIAGMGASVIACFATVGAVLLTVPVGLMFNGTPMPLLLAVFCVVLLARLLMLRLSRMQDQAA
ncbi:drug resistance transporter, Bcr/CflA subfamily protein [Roseobacter sp. AzwK-3b]|uniref:MFS transporter n=1 Tax=Roseobacter sp. AzwK-3b TaxID=351016 RepID=UPI0001568FE3|nr:MFS transporter [Roseobacter sp. AzwK-3b]EDM70901.1 drug resistance transporter, Bcr/CflA subfamily protein [Roseobacter sp. AzwK-3b]